EKLGEDLFRVDGEHPALVRLAPALVGTPDSGMVRARRHRLRREGRGSRAGGGDPALSVAGGTLEGLGRGKTREFRAGRDPDARRGRARHLVLVGAVAVLHARLAAKNQGTGDILS